MRDAGRRLESRLEAGGAGQADIGVVLLERGREAHAVELPLQIMEAFEFLGRARQLHPLRELLEVGEQAGGAHPREASLATLGAVRPKVRNPPSTTIHSPLMKSASSDSRNETALLISGAPGAPAWNHAQIMVAVFVRDLVVAHLDQPRSNRIDADPERPSSCAADFVNMTTLALDVL